MDEDNFFCRLCKKRLNTVDEIELSICDICKKAKEHSTGSVDFFCWACGRKLFEKSEIAQGICHYCKASINRKIGISLNEQ